jgi:hypothetical protein
MAGRTLPSPETLRQLLRYEPETGRLFWREAAPEHFQGSEARSSEYRAKIFNSGRAGREAIIGRVDGYAVGRVLGKQVKAHRVIWAMVYGDWPEHEIDHINGVRDDNRLENLRHVSRSENQRNCKLRRDSSSGVTGVRRSHGCSTWTAFIGNVRLGAFKTKEAAIAARKAAERDAGYSRRHGS